MNIVILDLEWNGAYSRRLHGFINEIIEFGAVKLDAQLNITCLLYTSPSPRDA